MEFLAGYQFAWAFKEELEDLKWLLAEPEANIIAPQFAGYQVHFKAIEANPAALGGRRQWRNFINLCRPTGT